LTKAGFGVAKAALQVTKVSLRVQNLIYLQARTKRDTFYGKYGV
jgi:hypothetical protein